MESTVSNFLAGGLAGCVTDFTLYPLDVCKTLVQAKMPVSKYSYKGVFWALSSSFPCAATFFSSYYFAKQCLDSYLPQSLLPFVCAVFGGATSAVVRNPFEVCKQQVQAGYHTGYSVPVAILRTQGFKGFFAGLGSLVFREVPFDVVQMVSYEVMKTSQTNAWMDGAVAGGIAALVTTPIDVVKTRLMLDSGKGHYRSVLQSFQKILKEEGFCGVWKGGLIRIVYTCIGGAIFFGSFEFFKTY